jgi:hypothetical protein
MLIAPWLLSSQESCLVEFPEFVGSLDHQLCPSCPTLLGCVYEGDVWVLDAKSGKKHQLTKTAGHWTLIYNNIIITETFPGENYHQS